MTSKGKYPKLRFPGFTDPWEQRKLSDLGDIFTGNTPKTTDKDNYADKGLLWVTPTDITDNIIRDTEKHLSKKGEKLARIIPHNSILVTSIASIGKNALTTTEVGFNQQINAVVPDKKNDSYFLLTQSFIWSARMKSFAAAATMQIVNKSDFSNIITIVPKYNEQLTIGSIFRLLDQLIASNQREGQKLKDLKVSYMDKLFPKNGSRYPELRFPGFTDPWEQRKLGDFGSVAMNKRIFKEQTSEKGDVPFFKIGTFGGTPDAYISRSLFEEYKQKYQYPQKGDLLISASGSIGRIVEYDGSDVYYQDSNIVWLKHDARLDNLFLKQFYAIVKWQGLEGSTIKRLYNKNILETPIKLPSIKEQHAIGKFLNQIDFVIASNQREGEKFKELKQAYLNELFV